MKILVTGSAGFIGSALCRSLCEEGHEVLAFHRPTALTASLNGVPVRHIVGDLLDRDSIERAVEEKPDVIYHLGAQLTAAPSIRRMENVNLSGTRDLLQAAQKCGAGRIILMSTAYALGLPEIPLNDDLPPLLDESYSGPFQENRQPFTRSKKQAEQEAQLAAAAGMDIVIVNPTLVVGPGDHYRRNSSFLVGLKKSPPEFFIKGGVNLLSIGDVVKGLMNACRYGERGKRYLLTGRNIRLKNLVTMCAEIGGFRKPHLLLDNTMAKLFYENNPFRRNLYPAESEENGIYSYPGRFFFYDHTRARLQLHLDPPGSIEDAIREAYKWFEGNA